MRNTGIKAIETRYKGYRFRSRLEARWAVYFDRLGVAYEYEPEGFLLPSRIAYLPDFYLPETESYVEIKSKHSMDIELAKGNMEELCTATGKYGLLCMGDPMDNDIHLYGDICYENCHGLLWEEAEFIFGAEILDDLFYRHKAFRIGIVIGDRYDRTIWNVLKPDGEKNDKVVPFNQLFGFDRIPYKEQEIARQSRFEHGECG